MLLLLLPTLLQAALPVGKNYEGGGGEDGRIRDMLVCEMRLKQEYCVEVADILCICIGSRTIFLTYNMQLYVFVLYSDLWRCNIMAIMPTTSSSVRTGFLPLATSLSLQPHRNPRLCHATNGAVAPSTD